MPNKQLSGAFYIGANTCDGFVNYTSELISGLKRLYIIKGGPGTGKSTLMKRFADAAEKAGYTVDRYYCSSDSDSLDGVAVQEIGVGIIDGTSPHAAEPRYPGAVDSIIDLGENWNTEYLEYQADRIKTHTERKSLLYETVYKYLSVARVLRYERDKLLSECIYNEKCDAAAKRLIEKLGKGEGYSYHSRQVTSLGMKGVRYLDTYERYSEIKYYISDSRGLTGTFMRSLVKSASENRLSVWLSYDPLGEINAVMFPEKSTAVIGYKTEGAEGKIINTERFIDHNVLAKQRSKLRFISKLEKELMLRVNDNFSAIGKEHFALEDIYSRAMDFGGVTETTEKLIKRHINT